MDEKVQRAIELRAEKYAEKYGAKSEIELEALKAICAYEEVLSKKKGKRTRANRTWQMIDRHGIIEALERAVNRKEETQGYKALAEMGLKDYVFEAVILRYPSAFSREAIEISKTRLEQWSKISE